MHDWRLAGAAALGALAFLAVLWTLVTPRPPVVPKYRRRPEAGPQPSALSGVADRLTAGIDQALRGRTSSLNERLEIAGIRTPVSHLIALVGSGMLAVIALGLLLGSLPLALVLALLVPLAVVLWVRTRIDKRRTAFAGQLDETAQMLAGSLRSGYSFTQALATVGREAVSPTGDEFTRISNELRLGRPLGACMETTAQRMKSEDFSWIGQAVAINREVGGNLADVLEGVSRTIRERAQLRGQVASLSSEGKLSAVILIALPFVLSLVFFLINPSYISLLFTRPMGWLMLGVAVVLLCVGSLWLRASVQIKY